MKKRLVIKVGEYTNKDGELKGEYLKLGVILSADNGEYVLVDPCINLAGALIKQGLMNAGKDKKGKGDMVMVSIYNDDDQSKGSSQKPKTTHNDFDDDVVF